MVRSYWSCWSKCTCQTTSHVHKLAGSLAIFLLFWFQVFVYLEMTVNMIKYYFSSNLDVGWQSDESSHFVYIKILKNETIQAINAVNYNFIKLCIHSLICLFSCFSNFYRVICLFVFCLFIYLFVQLLINLFTYLFIYILEKRQ